VASADAAVRPSGRRLVLRGATAVVALAALVAIVIPLSDTNAVRQSQAAAASGDMASALGYAQAATQIEPYAASAQLQKALVLEQRDQIAPALESIRNATSDEPLNWQVWLVRSRVEAEAGHPSLSLQAFQRARSLNPHSQLFSK
jgi:Tfp pilus assembly protein PilF